MVVPVVAIPPSIEAGLAPYRDLFPRSETYQHILEYCTGLVVLDKPSINRLAACLVDGPAQSAINKALTRSPWSGEAVNERRLEEIQKHHRGKRLTIGIIDSTFSHHPRGEEKIYYDNPERQGKPIYCFTRHLTWSASKIIQVRCHRWDIEPLHERLKQFLGAEDSQLQTEAGVRRHLTLVFVVNSLLKSLDLSQPIGDVPMTEFQDVPPTFGQHCRRILFEVFHDLIQTMARWLEETDRPVRLT